jgi:FkbM family methyltransferase
MYNLHLLNGKYPLRIPAQHAKFWGGECTPEERAADINSSKTEEARVDAMHERIDDDTVLFYVGCGHGDQVAMVPLFASWGAQMFLFEPSPAAWRDIREVFDANDLNPAMCFPGFAATQTRMLNQQPTEGWPVFPSGEDNGPQGFKSLRSQANIYPQITIDDAVSWFKPPTMISVDTEGAEWQVLVGAEKTLIKHRPTLFISIHPEMLMHDYEHQSRWVRDWVHDIGYDETILDYQHELHCMYEPAKHQINDPEILPALLRSRYKMVYQ